MTCRPRRHCLLSLIGTMAGLVLATGGPAAADAFRLLAWNVESNRPEAPTTSDPRVIATQLVALLKQPETRAGIVALSEAAPADVQAYRKAVALGPGRRVDHATSASGGFRDADSLLLVVDAERFTIEEVRELHRYGGIAANLNVDDENSREHGAMRARSPLVVRLRDLSSGRDFWLVVVHLARGEADLRADQARMLRRWAEDLGAPAIAAGDFNFDFDFHSRRGNAGYDAMIDGNVWQWLEPDPLIDSNWAGDRNNPQIDRYPDSILDFVFVANGATAWQWESSVVVRPNDFPDDDCTSDHRPIIATLRPSGSGSSSR